MNYSFLRPAQHGDFENRLAELAMKVNSDFGDFRVASELAFTLFEKAQENMSLEEIPQFLKLIGHFKLLSDFAHSREREYFDLEAELGSYTTGNFVGENECIYLDHRDFANRYPNFRPDGAL